MNNSRMNLSSTLIISTLLLFACSPTESNQDKAKESPKQSEQPASDDQAESHLSEESVSPVLDAYMNVKQALVETDAENAAKAANTLVSNISDQNDEKLGAILSSAKIIANADEIEVQREAFEGLSESVYEFVKENSSGDAGIYKQFCPMAFDNKGAYWLSFEEEIRNPYFGDKMLKCGKVMESL